ncbi:MAG: hypothetical protein AAB018_04690, partial [Actinomycetota bacterium]
MDACSISSGLTVICKCAKTSLLTVVVCQYPPRTTADDFACMILRQDLDYSHAVARPAVSQKALAAARGDGPADLLITGGRVFSPATREWVTTDLAICDGNVVGWGTRDAEVTMDVDGAALCSGFVDAHMHLESSKVWVSEFVKAVLPNGTTAVACDPHEVAN